MSSENGSGREARLHSHPGIRSRLRRITDWESLAVQACYSSAALARLCGVSMRHLQRRIHSENGTTLGSWLNMLRLKHAYQRLQEGCSVKETAFSLGYKQVSHFSRNFKKLFRFNPSDVPITIRSNTGAQAKTAAQQTR